MAPCVLSTYGTRAVALCAGYLFALSLFSAEVSGIPDVSGAATTMSWSSADSLKTRDRFKPTVVDANSDLLAASPSKRQPMPPAVRYLQTPAPDGPEGAFLRLTRAPDVANRALPGVRVAAVWSVERLCGYTGILEPESTVGLPRPAQDHPPLGCQNEGTPSGGDSAQGTGSNMPVLDDSFVAIQLADAAEDGRTPSSSARPLGAKEEEPMWLLFARKVANASGQQPGGATGRDGGHGVDWAVGLDMEVLCAGERGSPSYVRPIRDVLERAASVAGERSTKNMEKGVEDSRGDPCVWLSPGDSPGARFLSGVVGGSITKKDVELVIAQYERNVAWSDVFAPIRTVYSKAEHPLPGSVPLDNVGRESHSFLTHIVRKYDNLAARTVFVQDHRPGISHSDGGQEQLHFHARSSLLDYLLSTAPVHMILGNVVTPDMTLAAARLSRVWDLPLSRPLAPFVSDQWREGGDPLVLDTWLPLAPADALRSRLSRACEPFSESDTYEDCLFTVGDFWRDIARHSPALPKLPPWERAAVESGANAGDVASTHGHEQRLLFFAHGAPMAVSRAAIRRHPRVFYEKLLEHVGMSPDPLAGYYTEMCWHYIFDEWADEAALMQRFHHQMKLAEMPAKASIDVVLSRLVAANPALGNRLKEAARKRQVTKGDAEPTEMVMRRQLIETQTGGLYGPGIDLDGPALLAFKAGVIYGQLCSLNSWVNGTSPCNWLGTECNDIFRVSQITLYQCELSGTISPTLANLTYLTMLELSSNALSGTLPPELGSLQRLSHLSVNRNFISGVVPPSYGSLTSLSVLSLHTNQLSGTLPFTLGGLQYLSYMEVHDNYLCGYPNVSPSILYNFANTSLGRPCSVRELNDLKNFAEQLADSLNALALWTSDNVCAWANVGCNLLGRVAAINLPGQGLSGPISALPELPYLAYLNLAGNGLTGTLPDTLAFMTDLEFLDLSYNSIGGYINLSGTIAASSLLELRYLSLAVNAFSGTIPRALRELPYLTSLLLGSNQLSGTVPFELTSLTSLTSLTVSANSLSGCLPPFANTVQVYASYTSIVGVCSDNNGGGGGGGGGGRDDNSTISIVCPPPTTIVVDPSFLGVNCPLPGNLKVPGVVDNAPCPSSVASFLNVTVVDPLKRTIEVSYSPVTFEKGVTKTVTWTAVATSRQGANSTTVNCTSMLTLVSQLPLVALEVTQAVQDWNHTVPLVAGKATLVRAFVELALTDTRQSVVMDGTLRAYREGMPLGGITKVNTDGNMLVVKNVTAARGYNRGAFNFLLPKEWTSAGDLTVCFVPAVNSQFPNASAVQCAEQDAALNDEPADCCLTVSFITVNEPCFRFVKVRYMEEGELRELSDRALREQWRRFRSMLPIPADSTAEFRTLDFIYQSRPPLRLVNNALDAARIMDKGERRCWYIGVLRGTGAGLAAFNGETAAYFVGRPESSFACGYERNRGVHEFLHNLNIAHAKQDGKTACTNTVQDEGDEFPFIHSVDANGTVFRPTLGPMGDNMTEVFGTDPVLVAAGAPSIVSFSSPRFVFALMSYCQPLNFFGCQARWIDKATYVQALLEIHERAPQGAQPVGGSTVLDKVMLRGTVQLDAGGDYDIQVEPILQICTSVDISSRTSRDPAGLTVEFASNGVVQQNFTVTRSTLSHDLLACDDPNDPECATVGGSDAFGDFSQDFTIGGVSCVFCFDSFDMFSQFSFDLLPLFSFDFFPQFSFDFIPVFSFDFFPQFSFDGYPFFTFDGVPFLLFDGKPQSQLDTALGPSAKIPASNGFFVTTEFAGFAEEISAEPGDFDGVGTGKIDFRLALDVSLPAPAQDLSSDPYSIRFRVTDDLSLAPVKVLFLSATSPVLGAVVKVPEGGVGEETEVQVCFAASDADPEPATLTATVHYCPRYATDRCACETLALDEPLNRTLPLDVSEVACLTFARSRLAKSDAAVLRVFLSDGLRASVGETEPFAVANNLPYVELLFPANDSYSAVGSNSILLKGTADDVEDGQLSNCRWFEASDPEDLVLLGTGVETTVLASELRATAPDQPCLSTHLIRLTCIDADEGEASDETTHSIAGLGIPPTITCPEPIVYAEADPTSCLARVTFPTINAADGCSGDPLTPTLVEPLGFVNGSFFPSGDTVVRYRVSEPITRSSADCQLVVRVSAPPPCFSVVPSGALCDLECDNPDARGRYVVQYTVNLVLSRPVELTPALECEWNQAWGVLGGVPNPADACQAESFAPPQNRRSLLSVPFVRITRLYFATEAEARASALLLAEALANGRLLAALRAILPLLSVTHISTIFLWMATITSDPHFQGPCGERFDFMGVPGGSYCVLTSPRVHVNARMMGADDAVWGASDQGAKHTWMEELAVCYAATTIVVSAHSPEGTGFASQQGRIWINGVEVGTQLTSRSLFREGDAKVERRRTRIKLSLGTSAKLMVEIVRAAWWEAGRGPGRNFLNLNVISTSPSLEWHGVLGQTFHASCDPPRFANDASTLAGAPANASVLLSDADMFVTSSILHEDCAVSKFVRPM